jgi:hypothetical protein
MNTKKWTKAVKEYWKELPKTQKAELATFVGTAPFFSPVAMLAGAGYLTEGYLREIKERSRKEDEIKKLKKKLRSVV